MLLDRLKPGGKIVRRLAFVAAMCAFVLAVPGAANPFVGEWELNVSKSKPDPKSPVVKTQTVKYVSDGTTLKGFLTTDGNPSAHPTVYDGKEHEYGGTSALHATHIIPTAKGSMLETIFKRDGKRVGIRKNTLSADGKIMTVTVEGTTPEGEKYLSVLVFEKKN
jgi:hypothetical protein